MTLAKKVRLAVTALAVSLLLLPTAGAKSIAGAPEWVLNQEHRDIGRIKACLAHDAIKVVFEKTNVCLLAKKPNWTIYFFNPTEKKIWSGPFDQFEARRLLNPLTHPKTKFHIPVVVRKQGEKSKYVPFPSIAVADVVGKGTHLGLPCTEYTSPYKQRHLVFWGADNIVVEPMVAHILCRLVDMPEIDQVPLYLRFNTNTVKRLYFKPNSEKNQIHDVSPAGILEDFRLGPQVVLITKSWKKKSFAASEFQVPVGLKSVKQISDITFSQSMKKELTEVIDDVGFTTRAAAKH